jgi:cell division protein FtsQ
MPSYQGRALLAAAGRRPAGRIGRILQVLGVLAVVAALAHVPWRELRQRHAVVTTIQVEGLHYLDAERVVARAGWKRGMDLLAVDFDRARQRLLADSRIREARLGRRWPRGLTIRIEERLPVLVVRHGVPWEMDAQGVLLAPLREGVVADVPLLSGVEFESLPAGTVVATPEVLRALRWEEAVSARELELSGQISEIDVADRRSTALLLMSGTRVRAPAWPPGLRRLSALRVVLADVKSRGVAADEVDLRFEEQVIVRPVGDGAVAAAASPGPMDPRRR